MNFKDGKLKVNADEKTITIKTLEKGEEISLTFEESYYDNLDLVDNTWRGGNIVFNSLEACADNELVLMVEDEKEFYMPEQVVGMDVNQKEENWLTFSEVMENGGVTLAKPMAVSEIEKIRDALNAKLRPKKKDEVSHKLNSEQRRKMYRRLKKKMVNRYTAIEESLSPVLESFNKKYEGKLAFAIDGVATGRTKNSFGQEDVRDIIVRWCLKNEVPFVIVPPQYTSQRCPECGEFHKQNRKTTNTYVCPSCGYFNENCDLVGALNIKAHGEFLLEKFKFSAPTLSVKREKTPLVIEFSSALREFFNFPQAKSKTSN
jgi:transposase